jgi:hypothetical protein
MSILDVLEAKLAMTTIKKLWVLDSPNYLCHQKNEFLLTNSRISSKGLAFKIERVERRVYLSLDKKKKRVFVH